MKKLKKIVLICVSILVICVLGILIVYLPELRSLASLHQVDDYGMYQMTYYGDYGFDEFLQTGAKSDTDIEAFVTKRLLKGLPIDLGITGAGCTVFVTRDDKGDILFCRNFDFEYAPSVQLYTKPKNGYASVSTVNLAFAGYSEENMPGKSLTDDFLTLAGPYLPFDGMNEKGVAIALLAVPEAHPAYDEKKITLNTTTSIRLVLDKAATVEEAVELLKQYNIYFSGDVTCHYLIADATGHSVLVEYYDDALQVVETDEDYQIASNFIAYQGVNIGEGYTEFDRYDAVKETIEETKDTFTMDTAVSLLAKVGIKNETTDKLQWSVIYDLTNGDGRIFANRHTDNQIAFQFNMAQ